ncbi:MAG: hypothetical protein M1821_007709 [Bathelium mastoideum]|nr:MAG: hypothetical protein M1821_007709 [Bathelium mastoideum]
MERKKLNHWAYTIGWICALPKEEAAAVCMLDEKHAPLPPHPEDDNEYVLGEIHGHNIAIACLPAGKTGTNKANRVTAFSRITFPAIRFSLLVGIGGGVPSETNDIRLGDVVVGTPEDTSGGVIEYDFGKTVAEGEFVRTGSLDSPPDELLHKVARLKSVHQYENSKIPQYMYEMGLRQPKMKKYCVYPGTEWDKLFRAEYDHPPGARKNCPDCDPSQLLARDSRELSDFGTPEVVIHYGIIASGNQVMKHGGTRDKLQKQYNILCFEMEAAGLDGFPSLVIRGICDYSDSHKNDHWQDYAAIAAAAYAKELLFTFEPHLVEKIPAQTKDEKAKDAAKADEDTQKPARPTQNTLNSLGDGNRNFQGVTMSAGGNMNFG